MLPGWMHKSYAWLAERFQGPSATGNVVLWLLRGCFGAMIIGMALLAFSDFYDPPRDNFEMALWAFVSLLGIGFLVVAVDLLVRDKQITTISAVFFGLLLGLLLGTLFSSALEPMIS